MPFTGKALYDNGVFGVETAEDIAPILSMISPFETPLLDALGDPPYPAYNILHEWVEDQLAPNTVTLSIAITSTNTAANAAETAFIMKGAVLENETTGEYIQVYATSGNTLSFIRGFGGTTATSVAAGSQWTVLAEGALEGSDVDMDISRARVRYNNMCQIVKKDVIVSGSDQAVRKVGGVVSEMDYQIQMRSREALRDLEKSVIRGILTTTNTIGAATYPGRTMKGLWNWVSTNVQTVTTLTESLLGNAIKSAWDQGARDIDVIVCDANYKRIIDSWNATRIRTNPNDATYRNLVSEYESSFGTQRILLSRWMRPNTLMCLASQRINVMPLQGRSFSFVPVARTGDSAKGMILGEYTLECKNQEGMAKIQQ